MNGIYNPFANRYTPNMIMGTMIPNTQRIMEAQAQQDSLKQYIRDFVSKYDTENMIIGLTPKGPAELTEGFFEVTGVYRTLESALSNLYVGEAVQLFGLEKERIYRTGLIRNTITECEDQELIVNIHTLRPVFALNEGGAAGHMAHIMDYGDMTCDDICQLVSDMFGGKVTDITEKIDGMNLQASVNNAGEVVFIRNKGDLNSERGGITLGDFISRWADNAHVRNTMTTAGEVIQQVCNKLGKSFFNPNETTRLFVNCEAIVSGKTNIIPYATQQVDFHDIFVYTLGAAGWEKTEVTKKGLNKIQQACEGIDGARITPEVIIKVTEKSAQLEQQYIKAFHKLWDDAKLPYSATIDEYKEHRFCKFMAKNYPWVESNTEGCNWMYERIINKSAGINIRSLIKIYPDHEAEVRLLCDTKKVSQEAKDVVQYTVKYLDETFIKFGNAVIKLCDGFVNGTDSSCIDVMLQDLRDALKEVQKRDDDTLNHKVAIQMQRLCGGNIDNIELNNAEGIVFNYKGRTMKITGSFAPLNAILGTRFD